MCQTHLQYCKNCTIHLNKSGTIIKKTPIKILSINLRGKNNVSERNPKCILPFLTIKLKSLTLGLAVPG